MELYSNHNVFDIEKVDFDMNDGMFFSQLNEGADFFVADEDTYSSLGNLSTKTASLKSTKNPVACEYWKEMAVKKTFEEISIYRKDLKIDENVEQEVCSLLFNIFDKLLMAKYGEMKASIFSKVLETKLDDIVFGIFESSNYDVVEIFRVQNKQTMGMWSAFRDTHDLNLESSKMVFHGSSADNCKSIAKKGFRMNYTVSAVYGKGIYTSNDVWECLLYSNPCKNNDTKMQQTFVVSEFLQGPSIIGSKDICDLGTDFTGKEIMTTTNQEKTIFCASRENQLMPTYRIVMCYRQSEILTVQKYNYTLRYNKYIWDMIKKNIENDFLQMVKPTNSTLPRVVHRTIVEKTQIMVPQVSSNMIQKKVQKVSAHITQNKVSKCITPLDKLAYEFYHIDDLPKYKGVAVGDNVTIVGYYSKGLHFNGQKGVVRKIWKNIIYYFSVELYNTALFPSIISFNQHKFSMMPIPGQIPKTVVNWSMLICKPSHFEGHKDNTTNKRNADTHLSLTQSVKNSRKN